MANPAREIIARVERAGGIFQRMTGKGHRRYLIGTTFIDIPVKGLDDGRLRANLNSQIKRALAAIKEEPHARIQAHRPVQEAPTPETPTAQVDEAPDGASSVADGDIDARLYDAAAEIVEARVPDGAASRSAPYGCPECGREFAQPLHLGRHRTAKHGAVATAKSAREREYRHARAGRLVVKAPVAPPPRVGSKDLLQQALEMADLLIAAIQELATERRLERAELQDKRETLAKLEQTFSVMRKDPGYLERR